MNANLSELSFQWMKDLRITMAECDQLGLGMVLAGPATSGKSYLLQREAKRLSSTEYGRVLYLKLQQDTEALRYLRQIIESISSSPPPKQWRTFGLSQTIQLLSRRLRSSNLKRLLLGNCPSDQSEFYEALFDVQADARAHGHVCGLVFAGRGDQLDFVRCTSTRKAFMRRYHEIPKMTKGDVLAAIKMWCDDTENLCQKAEQGDLAAIATVARITEVTEGNIGQLALFATIKNLVFPQREFSRALVDEIGANIRPKTG